MYMWWVYVRLIDTIARTYEHTQTHTYSKSNGTLKLKYFSINQKQFGHESGFYCFQPKKKKHNNINNNETSETKMNWKRTNIKRKVVTLMTEQCRRWKQSILHPAKEYIFIFIYLRSEKKTPPHRQSTQNLR